MAVSLRICAPLIALFILLRLGSLTDASDATAGDSLCNVRSNGEPTSCTSNCFRPDPVCGANGVTYWCGCPEAACAGDRVAKRGPCQVGNGGTGVVSCQAFLLLHIVWLIILGIAVLCGFL